MIRRKLRERRGITLSEMLVALAILGLVCLAVAGGLSASLGIYRDSVALSDAQTLASTLTQALMDDLRFARDFQTDAGGGLSYTSPSYGEGATVGQSEGHITIHGYELVGSGAYAGLTARAEELGYDGETVRVSLSIHAGTTLVRTVDIAVRPLNPKGAEEGQTP